MPRLLKRIAILLASIALVAWVGAWFATPSVPSDASFVVEQGDSASAVTARLKERGFVHSTLLFRFALARTGAATRLQPGVYDLSDVQSYTDIARALSSGSGFAPEVTVRVLEGWDLFQVADELAAKGLPGKDALFIYATQDPQHWSADLSSHYSFLADKPQAASLEGYLFPDTYRFFPDATVGDILDKMLGNFDRKLTPELRAEIAASGRSVFETVTMASIIEREVRGEQDQRMVADLFWRRLDIGMALQADSTVNYITRKGLAAVSYEDTTVDSRYNTYKYPGLPVGPIGNPGLQAIVAAINPLPNEYWFFLTDDEGTVHYGRTLDEHNENKNRYLR